MADFENGIPDFLQDLADASAKRGGSNRVQSELTTVNMKSPRNQGKILIVPVDGKNKGESAIKQLNRVACVGRWVSGTKKDGTEYGFVENMYFFLDPKYYGELTKEQMDQLDRIKSKFNTCNTEGKGGVGVHQFTLIQGLVVDHTCQDKQQGKPLSKLAPVILQFESKNFEKTFRKELTDMYDKLKNYTWLEELTNRELMRKRYLSIDFYLNKDEGAGFQVTVKLGKFDEDAVNLTGGTIGLDLTKNGEDFLNKFEDPIKTWMRLPQDKPRFNEDRMNDIEVALNQIIKGEQPVAKRNVIQGTPITPNSNEGFKAQDESAPIEIAVKEDTAKKVEEAQSNDQIF